MRAAGRESVLAEANWVSYAYRMSDTLTVAVSWKGQAVLPLEWRRAHGLSDGGPCDAREVNDGKGSLLITPRPARKGAKGLLNFLLDQEAAFAPTVRHTLPSK